MKRYCFDMSGISTPLEMMPPDIHKTMWEKITEMLASGVIAVTREIYDEMCHIGGVVGDCIKKNQGQLVLEVDQDDWDCYQYIEHVAKMQITYQKVISELNGNRKNTVGLNDISIIALGKTLRVPVVSMESETKQISDAKKRIPEVCQLEGVEHYNISRFLRAEKIII